MRSILIGLSRLLSVMLFWAEVVPSWCSISVIRKVQDFVYGVVDNLLTKYPDIAYIKWDANMAIMNHGSQYSVCS